MRKTILFASLIFCFWMWAACACSDNIEHGLLWLIWPGIIMAGNIIREVHYESR